MKKGNPRFTRREFIGTSAMATGALAFTPGAIANGFFGSENAVATSLINNFLCLIASKSIDLLISQYLYDGISLRSSKP